MVGKAVGALKGSQQYLHSPPTSPLLRFLQHLNMKYLALPVCLLSLHAQTLMYSARSLANSGNGNDGAFVQGSVLGANPYPNGVTFLITTFDEGDVEIGEYLPNGTRFNNCGWARGSGLLGGQTITSNSSYLFAAQRIDNGAHSYNALFPGNTTWPPNGHIWYVVSRRSITNCDQGVTFSGAKGGDATIPAMFLVVDDRTGEASDDTTTALQARITGMTANNTNLFVGSSFSNSIKVYSASTMAAASPASFTLPASATPGAMAVDGSGNVWLVSRANKHIYKCVLSGTWGCTDSISISGWNPLSLAISNTGKLMVGDGGPAQQITFWDISGSPSLSSTVGTSGGAYGNASLTATTLLPPLGVGTDSSGNIYVVQGGVGARILALASDGVTKVSEVYGLTYVDTAACDPADDCATVHTREERFSVAYPGGALTWNGVTIDPLTYTTDDRIPLSNGDPLVQYPTILKVVNIGSTKLMYTTDQYGHRLSVYRWNSGTGKWIPCGMIVPVHNIQYLTGVSTAGAFKVWIDGTGGGTIDGIVQAGEVSTLATETQVGYGWDVAANGDVYQTLEGAAGVRKFAYGGLTGGLVPVYTTYSNQGIPAPFTKVERAKYDSVNDVLWACGYTAAHPQLTEADFGLAGSECVKFTAWSTTPVVALRVPLPYDAANSRYVKSIAVTREYLFAGIMRTTSDEGVHVYSAGNGGEVAILTAGQLGSIPSSWIDGSEMIQAYRRNNGETVVFVEDNVPSHVLMYRFAPNAIATVEPGRQSIVVRAQVTDPAQCTIVNYTDAARTIKSEDTDNSLFSGSENAVRPFNVITGNQVAAVIGRRTSETAADNRLHSRSLEVAAPQCPTITDNVTGAQARLTVTTLNIPWGDSAPMETPVVPDGTGRLAYPDIDYSLAGRRKSYIDPLTGVRIWLAASKKSSGQAVTDQGFAGAFNPSTAWTNQSNVTDSTFATHASYTGTTQAPLFLPFSPPQRNPWYDYYPDDVHVTFNGSASGCTGTDCDILVCLGTNVVPTSRVCSGAEYAVTLPTSTGSVAFPPSFPTPLFDGWGLTHPPRDLDEIGVPQALDGESSLTIASSVATISTTYGSVLPLGAAAGQKIKTGSTWYTLGAIADSATFPIQESSVNVAASSWQLGNFGIWIRKRTTNNNTINLAAKFAFALSESTGRPANGVPEYCERLDFDVTYAADGVTPLATPYPRGSLCYIGGSGRYVVLLLSTGETRFISRLPFGWNACGGPGTQIPQNPFSPVDPYSLIFLAPDDSYGTNCGSPTSDMLKGWMTFYKATYDVAGCKFKEIAGGQYGGSDASDTCFSFVNQNPGNGHPGATVTEQIAAAMAALPEWGASPDPDLHVSSFVLRAIFENSADMQFSIGQNDVSFHVEFSVSTFATVKAYSTFGGAVPSLRWAATHATGWSMGSSGLVYDDLKSMSFSNGARFLSGPPMVKGISCVSLDGTTYDCSDTHILPGSLISTASCTIQCGTPIAWTIGSQSVDLTRAAGKCTANSVDASVVGLYECIWLRVTSDQPCDFGASVHEVATWPCPWSGSFAFGGTFTSPNGYAAPIFQKILPGDYIQKAGDDPLNMDMNGKVEQMQVLTKTETSPGSGIWDLELKRWTRQDNALSDLNTGAAFQFRHLYEGAGGSTYANGWAAMMAESHAQWVQTGTPAASTSAYYDGLVTCCGHSDGGPTPDGTGLRITASGASRNGVGPGRIGKDYLFNDDSTFWNGNQLDLPGNILEQYVTLNNFKAPTVERRSMFFNSRHVNPDSGTGGETPGRPWTYTPALTPGQTFTYLIPVQNAGSVPEIQKRWRPGVETSRVGLTDISGPGSTIDDTKPYTFCLVYVAGECIGSSTVGQMYVSAPKANMGIGGCTANTYRWWTPCPAILWHYTGMMTEGWSEKNDPTGRFQNRRLTMGLVPRFAVYQFNSPHLDPTGQFAFYAPGCQGVRCENVLVKIPPPSPIDSGQRNDFVPLPVTLPKGSGYARIRFGSPDYGDSTHPFHCTTRQEDCVKDSGNDASITLASDYDHGSAVRSDFTGLIGMRITVGANPVVVDSIGRIYLAGDSSTHTLKIVDQATGLDVAGSTVTVNFASGNPSAGFFKYVALSPPVTLAASHQYFISSSETNGGDTWLNESTLTTSGSAVTVNIAAYNDGAWHDSTVGHGSFGPLNFTYQPGTTRLFGFDPSDSLLGTDCRSGCTINIPLLPGKVTYYRVERSPNGTSGWVAGPTQIKAN